MVAALHPVLGFTDHCALIFPGVFFAVCLVGRCWLCSCDHVVLTVVIYCLPWTGLVYLSEL